MEQHITKASTGGVVTHTDRHKKSPDASRVRYRRPLRPAIRARRLAIGAVNSSPFGSGGKIMPEFFRSKLGIFFAGIYLLVILYAALEGVSRPPEPMSGFAMLILTAPFSFLLALVLDFLGVLRSETGNILIYPVVVFGAVMNMAILHLIGCSISWFFIRLDPGMLAKEPEDVDE